MSSEVSGSLRAVERSGGSVSAPVFGSERRDSVDVAVERASAPVLGVSLPGQSVSPRTERETTEILLLRGQLLGTALALSSSRSQMQQSAVEIEALEGQVLELEREIRGLELEIRGLTAENSELRRQIREGQCCLLL